MENMNNKLLPCPFCGGEAHLEELVIDHEHNYFVECGGAKCSVAPATALFETKEEAIKSWNTRKPAERILEKLKELYQYNSEQADIYRDGADTDAYFREKKDMYMDRAYCYGVAIRTVKAGGTDEG